jgi:rhodanese-related sulfurtransferase
MPGAIQIGLEGPFASWAAILIRPAQPIVLLAANSMDAEEAQIRLARVGVKSASRYALADEQRWRREGVSVASIGVQRCRNFHMILQTDPSIQVVDVRSRSEWLKGHLPGAISIPLLDLDSKGRFIDPSRPSFVYCHEGYRATTAASILLREGASDIGILIDGIEGWLASGLPLETPGR